MLEMIEVQSGHYLGEDDIVRLEDSYGRKAEGDQTWWIWPFNLTHHMDLALFHKSSPYVFAEYIKPFLQAQTHFPDQRKMKL